MTTTRTILILSLVGVFGVFGMSACRGKPTCVDCEGAAEPDDNDASPEPDLPPLPDLPCGGADLMTDNLNCGSCGHECGLYYPGTEYEAGSCNAGKCGPGWSDCVGFGHACVPNGCSGLTGMMFDVLLGNGCSDGTPLVTLTDGCDEPIPWMTPTENHIEVACCCDFQPP